MNIFGKSKNNERQIVLKKENDRDKNGVLEIVNAYHEKYIYLLNTAFQTALETNPQAFRLTNISNLRIIHFSLDNKIIPNSEQNLALIYTNDENLEYEYYDFTSEEYYDDFSDFSHDHIFIENLLQKELNIERQNIVFCTSITALFTSYKSGVDIKEVFGSILLGEMKNLIREEGREYQNHVNYPSGYYAKNAARYSYSLLDLSPIINKVDNEDFEYQLDQAIAAYDNSLYMASCATLGVCLETVCKIIIIRSGGKIKDSDATMLDKLGERLRTEGLISYKDNSRIGVSYRIRNLSSHTSPGKVTQNDCHFLINTIQSLVEQYLD